jgi:hypothetical protein
MKEDLKLIDIGNGNFILCLNNYILCAEEKKDMDEFINNKLRNLHITNILFLPFTIKEAKK